jgi:muramidase (phage lysozyme)
VLAFLDTIAQSEQGPLLAIPETDDGYATIVGSTPGNLRLCSNYDDHPQEFVKVSLGNGTTVTSSAAGRYQFLARVWDSLARDLRLEDFRPENQDRGAIELVRECGAIPLIRNSRIADAIEKCAHIWASFPGAGYGQPERKMSALLSAYQKALKKYADFSNVKSGVESTAKKVIGGG